MATIRQLRGRWQAMVRRRGVPPRCKSFDKRTDATRWARELEAEADRSGWVADTRLAEKTTLGELLTRYRDHVSPTKRSAHTGVTDAQVAETFEGLGSGHFTRHQARSYRLLFTFACPALFEDVLNILHENRSLRGGLAAGATMAFLVFQAAAARARLVSADLCHVQV
jgi:hypothetical protein